MLLCALECSSKAASCALFSDERLLCESYLDCGLTHSQTLLPLLDNLCRAAGVTPEEFEKIAVSCGPGSFTGLRIGLSLAKAMAAAQRIPAAGMSTLLSLAYNLTGFTGSCCAALDARRGQVYYALFTLQNGGVQRICADRAAPLEELAADVKRMKTPVFFVGDGALLCYNHSQNEKDMPPLFLAPAHLRLQRASGVGLAALCEGVFHDAHALTPHYLRLSQAERERLEKQGGKL